LLRCAYHVGSAETGDPTFCDDRPFGGTSGGPKSSQITLIAHSEGRYSRSPAYRPDPDNVRARLYKILAEARSAQRLPWESTRVSLYRTIFPQMTLWLPEDEGAQLRFEFEAELVRLETP
jgi:hypothetical protein